MLSIGIIFIDVIICKCITLVELYSNWTNDMLRNDFEIPLMFVTFTESHIVWSVGRIGILQQTWRNTLQKRVWSWINRQCYIKYKNKLRCKYHLVPVLVSVWNKGLYTCICCGYNYVLTTMCYQGRHNRYLYYIVPLSEENHPSAQFPGYATIADIYIYYR